MALYDQPVSVIDKAFSIKSTPKRSLIYASTLLWQHSAGFLYECLYHVPKKDYGRSIHIDVPRLEVHMLPAQRRVFHVTPCY